MNRVKAKDGPTNMVPEDQTLTTTIKVDTHKTPHNTKPKEKDVRKEKENLEIQEAKAKAKVEEKETTLMEIETPMTSKNLKSPTAVKR
jgi:hypothetical protein